MSILENLTKRVVYKYLQKAPAIWTLGAKSPLSRQSRDVPPNNLGASRRFQTVDDGGSGRWFQLRVLGKASKFEVFKEMINECVFFFQWWL